MASVFTFEPDPPRVASPWLHVGKSALAGPSTAEKSALERSQKSHMDDRGITKLEAEPQEGPVEYKLHLLLRPRRRLSASSTVLHVSGSHQSKSRMATTASDLGSTLPPLPPIPAPTSQSRHNRLQNLTTQLLWRLQQSSPFHSSAKSDLVIPTILDKKNDTLALNGLRKLLSGLEESQGALYEIGVSDDGTLVGLTEDELEESLSTLRIMASSLGCRVDVLRRMTVGTCRWTEETQATSEVVRNVHDELLWIAEAHVVPNMESWTKASMSITANINTETVSQTCSVGQNFLQNEPKPNTEQLRVSLTGSTTSGKSSLLGTLSTSTLDNGRGKSRLSLLKHRHEIASGVTSSIVTELIGYQQTGVPCESNVINFSSGNISSWNDIHSACELNRLVVLNDSAGHPRYRRTTVRGLLSWAPHWTLCCVAADDDEHDTGKAGATSSSREILGSVGADIDLSRSHLELCLALSLPLAIVITKLDLASSSGLRETLKKILTVLKAAGRQPVFLSSSTGGGDAQNLQSIPDNDWLEVTEIVAKIKHSGSANLVPIILTSAVTGAGISKLHALLHQLPVQFLRDSTIYRTTEAQNAPKPDSLFLVDEVFTSSEANSIALLDGSKVINGHILSGLLSYGTLGHGDTVLVGPFSGDTDSESSTGDKIHLARSCPVLKGSRSLSPKSHETQRSSSGLFASRGSPVKEAFLDSAVWRRVRVVSLRNLRLPVRHLLAGQVGTVGITYEDAENLGTNRYNTRAFCGGRIRKGMILLHGSEAFKSDPPRPHRRFSAVFEDVRVVSMAPGSSVIVYIASIRASAKVLAVRKGLEPMPLDEIFNLDGHDDAVLNSETNRQNLTEVAFEFLASTEWFESGSQILVMPERADAGNVGLEGFVGATIESPPRGGV